MLLEKKRTCDVVSDVPVHTAEITGRKHMQGRFVDDLLVLSVT